jgi:putative PIN family toxin of toxin-antitoxin system
MKILLDTNVLFSGLEFRGIVGRLLEELILEDHTLVTSDYILEKLRGKIRIKFKGSQKEAALDLLLRILSSISVEVKRKQDYQANLAAALTYVPEQDAPILALAMLEDVDYFVTGDKKDFLENPKLTGTLWQAKIVSPKQLLELL